MYWSLLFIENHDLQLRDKDRTIENLKTEINKYSIEL
jgi:hypothetical protein